jgi:hypothetical protein
MARRLGPGDLARDIDVAFATLACRSADALLVTTYALFIARAVQLATSDLTNLGDGTLASDQHPSKIFVDQPANPLGTALPR